VLVSVLEHLRAVELAGLVPDAHPELGEVTTTTLRLAEDRIRRGCDRHPADLVAIDGLERRPDKRGRRTREVRIDELREEQLEAVPVRLGQVE
jgi:hypothetical protein